MRANVRLIEGRTNTARRNLARIAFTLLAGFLVMSPLCGCLLIGGSSRGGFFIFPGGLGLVVLIVVVALLLRRR